MITIAELGERHFYSTNIKEHEKISKWFFRVLLLRNIRTVREVCDPLFYTHRL